MGVTYKHVCNVKSFNHTLSLEWKMISYTEKNRFLFEIVTRRCFVLFSAPAVLTPNKYVYACNSNVAVQILPNIKAGTTVTVSKHYF